MTISETDAQRPETPEPEHLDVLVIGAGISGIGMGHYLRTLLPDATFAILESRDDIGGTWDLFRYPGIRSDSDLFTFGYEFKPWTGASIATADAILGYLRETVQESHLDDGTIRFHHKVVGISWSSDTARWTVDVERSDTGTRETITAGWIFSATGYYDYEQGFTPHFEGREDFEGTIVHPQHWPEDLDWTGKRVVVIGSGATAVTLVPAIAETAEHVIMLQRTPTYILPVPSVDPFAARMRKWLGDRRAHALTRRKNIARQQLLWKFTQRFPSAARRLVRHVNVKQLPEGFDVDTHFNPPYNVWDQRLCTVPDGDLYRAIRGGSADVVTDRIVRFTSSGILLESGRELDADVIVTATGLNLLPFSGLTPVVDGVSVHLPDHVAYKGMMLSDIPNFAFAIGYTNSSWTLKIGLLCEHFCRIVDHMRSQGLDTCVPVLDDPSMPRRPLLDFGAGYVQRSIDRLPQQGESFPWQMSMSYRDDVRLVRRGPVIDEHLRFLRAGSPLAGRAIEAAQPSGSRP